MDGLMQAQIAAFLPEDYVGRVLDYGAGNSPYRRFIRCDRYVSADVGQNLAGDIDYLIVPGEPLPIAADSFDLVLLLDVLEHVPDPAYVLAEIRRLLAPGGRLIISLPFLYREHETPNDFVRYTAFGVRELLAHQHGSLVRVSKAGNLYYTLLSLFLERGVGNGESNRLGAAGRTVNRALRALVPLLAPLLRRPPKSDDGIYHHLLVEVSFP
ncbi:class I SAM-dependent methyltransferase [Sphingorhabdus sp.]|uniref:class I SAM-dependent methyltransferase n=1 Tax=Sphingorhabdus sp. TaxID=1902408 RepID=UPI0035AE14BA